MRRAGCNERETEARERKDEKNEDCKEDTKSTHIRRRLPPVLTLAGGPTNMTMVRALFLATLLGGLALVACGSAGGGGVAPTANPAITNMPGSSPMPSSDPYSEYGY
jgi:hypothetical protein